MSAAEFARIREEQKAARTERYVKLAPEGMVLACFDKRDNPVYRPKPSPGSTGPRATKAQWDEGLRRGVAEGPGAGTMTATEALRLEMEAIRDEILSGKPLDAEMRERLRRAQIARSCDMMASPFAAVVLQGMKAMERLEKVAAAGSAETPKTGDQTGALGV